MTPLHLRGDELAATIAAEYPEPGNPRVIISCSLAERSELGPHRALMRADEWQRNVWRLPLKLLHQAGEKGRPGVHPKSDRHLDTKTSKRSAGRRHEVPVPIPINWMLNPDRKMKWSGVPPNLDFIVLTSQSKNLMLVRGFRPEKKRA